MREYSWVHCQPHHLGLGETMPGRERAPDSEGEAPASHFSLSQAKIIGSLRHHLPILLFFPNRVLKYICFFPYSLKNALQGMRYNLVVKHCLTQARFQCSVLGSIPQNLTKNRENSNPLEFRSHVKKTDVKQCLLHLFYAGQLSLCFLIGTIKIIITSS